MRVLFGSVWRMVPSALILLLSASLGRAEPLELPLPETAIRSATADGVCLRILGQMKAEDSSLDRWDYIIQKVFVDPAEGESATMTVRVSLPDEDLFIRLLPLTNRRFALVTRWNARPITSTIIHLIDAGSMTVFDELATYHAVISPDRRYIAYQRFFYPHGLPGMWSLVVHVYDLHRTPAENRIHETGNPPDQFVGFPVYPHEYLEAQKYIVESDCGEEESIDLSSPLLWAEDSSAIVFFATRVGRTAFVKVYIAQGLTKAIISEAPVDTSEFTRPDLTEAEAQIAKSRSHFLSVRDLWWDGPEYLMVHPEETLANLKTEFRMAIPRGK